MKERRKHWQQQGERGSATAIAFLIWVGRRMGRRVARGVLMLPLLWFFVSGLRARAGMRDFLARVLGRPARFGELWQQFHRFAIVSLDRVFLMMGVAGFRIDSHGTEVVHAALAEGRGALLVTAHFGSFEAMRVLGERDGGLPLAILLDRAHGALFTTALEQLAPDLARNVIDVGVGGPALVLKVREALARNQLVGIMVDRARGDENTLIVPFLGAPAPFPASPWQLALAVGCPIVLGFAVHLGRDHYATHFELFSAGLSAPRGERAALVADCVRRYAERLERQVQAAPDNWFNFYPFWQSQ